MSMFFELASPDSVNEDEPVYGKASWARRFGLAEWSDIVDLEQVICPVDPEHASVGDRVGNLAIVLPSPRVGDFVWTWHSECLVTDRVLTLFREAGFTGFKTKPVAVEKVKRVRKGQPVTIPTLWELVVAGKGGHAHPDSGIRVIYTCEACGMIRYSSYRNGIIVDEREWDGSDFFTVNGYPKHILVTERVKDLIVANELTNCLLIPSHQMRWPEGLPRPEELHAEKLALARRDLASLLADLESPDRHKWWEAVSGLREKRDPAAIEFLLKGFSRQDPLDRDWVASAVARIAGHAETPPDVRRQTVARLTEMLRDTDPRIRESAAATLGSMREAGEAMMKLLQDPEESVRQTAVFVLGFVLRYRPALEALKGMTRDPSRSVRETAKRALRELASEKVDDSG
mgnify:FL=1